MTRYIDDQKIRQLIENFKTQENSEYLILCLSSRLIELCIQYDLTTSEEEQIFIRDIYATKDIRFEDLNKTH
ncbi:hypothetical protein CXF71_18725 [Colwellia sp. 12G3]|nr:hypothetical protein CXF71_18725 [Colwellia sp. 12G3]